MLTSFASCQAPTPLSQLVRHILPRSGLQASGQPSESRPGFKGTVLKPERVIGLAFMVGH